jgi:predicted TIM-barrel fold metal-dependent hydrolase
MGENLSLSTNPQKNSTKFTKSSLNAATRAMGKEQLGGQNVLQLKKRMRIITLEEHFASPAWLDGAGRGTKELAKNPQNPLKEVPAKLIDLGKQRLAEMDAAGIDMQVLSLNSPGVEQLDEAEAVAVARETNDYLAAAVRAFPDRFGGFAALPLARPDDAAKELERMVHDHGFKGANINGHVRERYLDDPFFRPALEAAEALGVPIYLHPTQPPKAVTNIYFSGFSPEVDYIFSTVGWGWHIETAVHVVRMILGGVFDRLPRLQVIVGHMGEGLPFMLERMKGTFSQRLTKLQRPVEAYLRENVHYTFAGFNYTPTFLDLLMEVGVDRIMFSCDYPYGSMSKGRAFLDGLPVSDADREKIAYGNAVKLMGL